MNNLYSLGFVLNRTSFSLDKMLSIKAIWEIEVEDLPAFVLVDDKGTDFFQQIKSTSGYSSC